jgi:hypothetical protein
MNDTTKYLRPGSIVPVNMETTTALVQALRESQETLRDMFAAAALQGLLANPGGPIQANTLNGWNFVNCGRDEVAALAYFMAGAMLEARKK